jgi:hypothetical protein
MESIKFEKSWRYGRLRNHQTAMVHAGTYRIGKDIDEKLAAQALKIGVAVRVKTEVKPERIVVPRGAKSKGMAPENKAHGIGNHLTSVE